VWTISWLQGEQVAEIVVAVALVDFEQALD